jgi:hypothetical protein
MIHWEGIMELTKQCIEEIVLVAREVESGTLTIVIQARPEDNTCFDLELSCKIRRRIRRNGRTEGMGVL